MKRRRSVSEVMYVLACCCGKRCYAVRRGNKWVILSHEK